jgi:protein-disulfide isomerase
MHDLIYERQEILEADILPSWAQELGLDLGKFGAAIRQGDITKRIKEDRTSGIHSGVNGTPSFFINGTRHDDAPDYDSLAAALEQQLEEL